MSSFLWKTAVTSHTIRRLWNGHLARVDHGLPLRGRLGNNTQSVHGPFQLDRQSSVDEPVACDRANSTFKLFRNDDYFKVRFRIFRHIVHVGFVQDHQVGGFKRLGKLFGNGGLDGEHILLRR